MLVIPDGQQVCACSHLLCHRMLFVQNTRAQLTAVTLWGVLRGLETFSQLVQWSSSPEAGYWLNDAPFTVNDWPRFTW